MPAEHSTAFEQLVRPTTEAGDDLVGLLAYAYYKRDKRDRALIGNVTPDDLDRYHLNLTPGLLEQYRENALRRLEAYATSVVASVEPDIQERTRTDAINSARGEIISAVHASTSWWQAIIWNVVAWLISLAITLLVAVGLGKVVFQIAPK